MGSFQAFAESVLVPAQLVCVMLAMGATLGVRDFVTIAKNPVGLAIGLGYQLVLIPALAGAFIAIFDLGPGWAVGLILVAACPGGTMSNLLTFLGRGNAPLSVALTTVTSLACIVTIPVILSLFASQYLPPGFEVPAGKIMRDIVLYLLVPVIVGMLIFRFLPAYAARVSTWAVRAALVLVVVIATSALGSGRMKVDEYGFGPPLVILGFALTLAIVTPHLSRLFGRHDYDTTALTIQVLMRNVGIALLLVFVFFDRSPEQGHVLYTCLFYSGIGGPIALYTLFRHRYKRSPVPFRRPRPKPGGSDEVRDLQEMRHPK
jgi:BASS family bile acid:Na+ symporter